MYAAELRHQCHCGLWDQPRSLHWLQILHGPLSADGPFKQHTVLIISASFGGDDEKPFGGSRLKVG